MEKVCYKSIGTLLLCSAASLRQALLLFCSATNCEMEWAIALLLFNNQLVLIRPLFVDPSPPWRYRTMIPGGAGFLKAAGTDGDSVGAGGSDDDVDEDGVDDDVQSSGNVAFDIGDMYPDTSSRYDGFCLAFLIASRDLVENKGTSTLFINRVLPAISTTLKT
uniref:Uncharacterized protein n=1 Tax=Glossina austeni TaxID=7395 RepID=A0A1A9VU09_GLOAU